MKRYYRNRFILGAMISFLILMILTVIGIWLFSYQQMERESDRFMKAMQQDGRDEGAFSQPAPPAMFGYTPDQRQYPSGFYEIWMDPDGTVLSIQRNGILEEADISVQQYVQQAVGEQASDGKIGSYKYSIRYQDDGTARMILLDISIQLQALYNILKSALGVSALLMVLLFLILLPVSSKVADAFLRNAERQKQFITDAGHDLKTPVAIIRSSLDVMELQGKSKWSENIRSQTERLEQLIGQLLMMSRLDEAEGKIVRERLDLVSLLHEEEQQYLPVITKGKIRWKEELPDVLTAAGDGKTVRQLMNLLLDNATRYTNENGEIVVSGHAEKKKTVLEISNTVDKLPEQKPEELAERFVRGYTARTQKTGGAGIGLSAVKRIAEMNGGTLTLSYQGEHRFCASVAFPSDRR